MALVVLPFLGLAGGRAFRVVAQEREFPPMEEVVKGYEARPGFITLYVDQKRHRILGEIPASSLRRPFLLATSIVGGQYHGWQWDDLMVFWERLDRQLLLVEPEIRHRGGPGALAQVVRSTYRDRVITSLPILTVNPSGNVVIDLKDLFVGQSSLFIGSLGGGSGLTKIVSATAFPQNVELEFDFLRSRGGGASIFGGGSYASGLAVHYSISMLPQTSYRPRAADDRIGYFLSVFKDFSKSPRDETRFVRYVNRWQLEKADPSLKLSPPKEPIIFYVEKSVPVPYRRYVHEGILEWNKAFEKVGILGAIVVRQQTDTQFNDLDPEDVRYNFFRWITSESSFAMGPSRVHPETGQILDADIIFDDAMLRDFLEEYGRLIEKGPVRELHPSLKRFLAENPQRHPLRRWLPRATVTVADGAVADHEPREEFEPPQDRGVDLPEDAHLPRAALRTGYCDFGHGLRHQVNYGLVVMQLMGEEILKAAGPEKGGEWPEEFVGQVLKEVVMHEVGHTLGLRHNFKASSWLPVEEINRAENPPESITGSVMDYNPSNISPGGKPQGAWNTRTIGPYDYWAIEYGYTLSDDSKELEKIASRVAENGLAYGTDEDTWSSDPTIARFDMGKEPLDYFRNRLELTKQVLGGLLGRMVKPGQGYQRARQAFDLLLYDYANSCAMAARYVGGNYLHRDHKGDANARPPVVPVPASKQKQALDLLSKAVLGEDALRFSPELLNHLAAGRWLHWGSGDSRQDPEYPIHDRILMIQLWTLFDLLNPRTLMLICDGELRVADGEDALTIPELFEKILNAVFTEIVDDRKGPFTNRKPLISSTRRNLQHELVTELILIALEGEYGSSPQSARTQAFSLLTRIAARAKSTLGRSGTVDVGPIDDYTSAHLRETAQRIEKALEASFTRNGGGGGSGGGVIIIGRTPEGESR
jgi:hypothetical protein